MLRKSTDSTTRTIARAKNRQILLLKQDNLSTIFLNSLPGLTTLISWLTQKPMIWKTRRLNLSTVKERSSNSRIKWLASKTSWTTSRAWKRNTETKIKISKRESIQNLPGTWNSQLPSRTWRVKSVPRKTKSCTWERSLRVLDTATPPFSTITRTCKWRSILWTTTSEWSPTRTTSWQRNSTSLCKPTKQSDRDSTARLEFTKSEQEMTNSWPPLMETLSNRSPQWDQVFRPTNNGIEQVIS